MSNDAPDQDKQGIDEVYDPITDLIGSGITECTVELAPYHKAIYSKEYNCRYRFIDGYMERWGRTEDDDNTPGVPEVVDCEVTTICKGPGGVLCPFCYKANTPNGRNMSFDTFKTVFDKLPPTVQQIAFSADANLSSNPDLFDMMAYCWTNPRFPVVPSISVAELDYATAYRLLTEATPGCVAVSLYADYDICYDTVKLLTDLRKELDHPVVINIQAVVAESTKERTLKMIADRSTDPRLAELDQAVFLGLKQVGRGEGFDILPLEEYKEIFTAASDAFDMFGVDVCATPKFLEWAPTAFEQHKRVCEEETEMCEAGHYSMYINVDGDVWPCSFLEGIPGWEKGESLVTAKSFWSDIWFGPAFVKHRKDLVGLRADKCKSCLYLEV